MFASGSSGKGFPMFAIIKESYMTEVVKNKMQELTKAELEIMQVIWRKGRVLVHDILSEM